MPPTGPGWRAGVTGRTRRPRPHGLACHQPCPDGQLRAAQAIPANKTMPGPSVVFTAGSAEPGGRSALSVTPAAPVREAQLCPEKLYRSSDNASAGSPSLRMTVTCSPYLTVSSSTIREARASSPQTTRWPRPACTGVKDATRVILASTEVPEQARSAVLGRRRKWRSCDQVAALGQRAAGQGGGSTRR